MRDFGLIQYDEPFTRLLSQGMVLKDGAKMSKSKGNTVDPQTLIDQYGADTARLFMMFAAPPEQSLEWSDAGVEGAARFIRKIWSFAYENKDIIQSQHNLKINWQNADAGTLALRAQMYKNLEQANNDMQRQQFNTVVSAAMKTYNLLTHHANKTHLSEFPKAVIHEGFSILLRLLNPITPHFTHVLWQELGYGKDIAHAPWPVIDKNAMQEEKITIIVQVNGKMRGKVEVEAIKATDLKAVYKKVQENESIMQHIKGKTERNQILVPNKLINIVIE
jgi:leucyl-tRNA synthetase